MSAFPQTHTTATTTTYTTQQVVVVRPWFDLSYLKSTGGILKVVEVVLDFICFICVVVGPIYRYGGAGWAEFVTIVSFIVTLTLLIMYLFHIIEILHVVPWLLVEMIYCALWSFFYLTASAVIAAGASNYRDATNSGAWGAAAFFGFILMAVYGVDCYLMFRAWRNGEVAQGQPPQNSTYQPS